MDWTTWCPKLCLQRSSASKPRDMSKTWRGFATPKTKKSGFPRKKTNPRKKHWRDPPQWLLKTLKKIRLWDSELFCRILQLSEAFLHPTIPFLLFLIFAGAKIPPIGRSYPGRGVTYDHRMRSLTTTDTCQGFWVTYDHKVRSLMTTEPHIRWQGQQNLHSAWGHLWPQNAVTYDHKTLSQQNNRRGWGGWDDNAPWLAHKHAERWSGLPALGLHTCWPILVGGGGVGGMITYHKALLQYYSALQSTTPYYKVLLESTTPVPLFTTKYYSSTTLYCSSTTPHQTLCSSCLPKFQPMLPLPTKVALQHHQIMRLPQEVKLQHDQILRLPRKVTL